LIRISRREFIRLVGLAYRQLPANFQKVLDNVDISVEERPTPEELGLLAEEGSLFGLYTGVPLPERSGGDPSLPDRIVIYRQPILRSCSTRAEVVKEIKVTLWHEVGHYLGLSEEVLHRLGYG
jgi:predicted Zn-dependent protease with MMP-like domain